MSRNAHTALVKGILQVLTMHKIPCWSNNTGAARIDGKRFVRFSTPGASDVFAVLPPNGHFLAIEAKTGKGRLSKAQKDFQAMVNHAGGVYVEVRDLEEFHGLVRGWTRRGEE